MFDLRRNLVPDAYAPCVLAPMMASKLLRVALGHHIKADEIQRRLPNAVFMQMPQLSKKVSVVDFAHTAFGKTCPFPVHIDDEGVTAQDVYIIKDGQRMDCITNRVTAAEMSLPLTGNARVDSNGSAPQISIRNLALLPQSDEVPAMLDSIKEGFYLVDGSHSEGSPKGEYVCLVTIGYRIKNGQICEKIDGCGVWGFADDFLQSIAMVGNDFSWYPDEHSEINGINAAVGSPTIRAGLNIGQVF